MEIFNGQIYKAPWPLCHEVIVQWFGKPEVDTWVLLTTPYRAAQHKGTAMMLCCYEREGGGYSPWYSKKELKEKLKNWKLLGHKSVILIES